MHAIIILGKADTLRFTALKKLIPGISQRMLTVTLRTLEEDGLVTRTIFPQIPPRVEYELTPLGRSLVAQLISLSGWANENRVHILRAREEYILKKN
ncbi:MAG: helix-turn-helix domain-containing protein [Daejeonella sp.]|uniref:winged helix-turn-helix transcriptional regulator n=1 Tax=Daejeonella sp. TaxID=2805397 RepID=UPI002733DFFF|nr:helix-turn-helix domain-containing protein [Daejeonella sp.]MDP3469571.1 helix-turn-helix domain-containing protein [Daejeonella sp.]